MVICHFSVFSEFPQGVNHYRVHSLVLLQPQSLSSENSKNETRFNLTFARYQASSKLHPLLNIRFPIFPLFIQFFLYSQIQFLKFNFSRIFSNGRLELCNFLCYFWNESYIHFFMFKNNIKCGAKARKKKLNKHVHKRNFNFDSWIFDVNIFMF